MALTASADTDGVRSAWLERLPSARAHLAERWSLTLEAPYEAETTEAWVAPATRPDGTRVVLKIAMPHMEGLHEAHGLRFWDGDGTVLLLDADEEHHALLLERCDPGTHVRARPEPEQDEILARLLRRLWRVPERPHPFRPLEEMAELWATETERREDRWLDAGLVRDGLDLMRTLPRTTREHVLLATDLHAGNVLSAQREPWLVIDPKPFVGDAAYDATQHMLNCGRLWSQPLDLVSRFSDLLGVDQERGRLWLFARLAAEWPRVADDRAARLARALAPG